MKHQAQPKLVALSEGPNISLDKPIILIGRHQECDIQIPSRKISRRHCCVAMIADHLVIRDLGSTNGVRINGIKVLEGSLQENDELTIGNVRYKLSWNGHDDGTLRAPEKNGIKSGEPPPRHRPHVHDESLDEPMALPDYSHAHPALPAKPAPHNGSHRSLEIPDDVPLAPLDPQSH